MQPARHILGTGSTLPHADKRQHVVNTGAVASRSRRSRQSLSNIASASGKRSPKTAGSTASSSGTQSPPTVTRPAPPLPSGSAAARSSPRAPRPLPTAPARAAGTPTASAARVPQIQLQKATPDSYGTSGSALPVPPTSVPGPSQGWDMSAPPSPSPLQTSVFDSASGPHPTPNPAYVAPSSPSPTFDTAPVLPIQIPQTGDAAMQQFFHDIVGQLQTISLRNSLPPSPIGSPVIGFRGSSYLSGAPNAGGRDSMTSQASSAAGAVVTGSGGDQFEDAEDDESDAGSSFRGAIYSPFPTPSIPQGSEAQHDPFRVRAASPSPVRPLSISTPLGQAPVRPRIAMRGSSREPPTMGRPTSRSSGYENGAGYDKENVPQRNSVNVGSNATSVFTKRVPPPKAPRPGAGSDRERATLGLAIQNVPNGGRGAQAGSPPFEFEMVEIPDSPTALKGHKNTMKRRKRKFLRTAAVVIGAHDD